MLPDISGAKLKEQLSRSIPEYWKPYIRLARLDRPIGIWLLLLPCWWGIILATDGLIHAMDKTVINMLKVLIGAVLMRSAGCIINDIVDRHLDKGVARTQDRPLASGEITIMNALKFLAALLALSFVLLLTMNKLTIMLGIASLVPVIAYPKMKRITWWPQLFLGFTFNWGALMGWTMTQGTLQLPALMLYLGGIFWTLGYDTIYAHQDKEDDAVVGIKSTARLLGDKSPLFVLACYIISLAFLTYAKYHTATPSILTPLLVLFPLGHAVWQLSHWNMNDPASSLRIFKSNQMFGLLVFLMLAI